jgi:hypothetical protein
MKFAQIDLSLFHVNSGILLQLWSGFIISFVADGSPQFTAQCSDGLYQITKRYPARGISRQCWKTFNDVVNCRSRRARVVAATRLPSITSSTPPNPDPFQPVSSSGQ